MCLPVCCYGFVCSLLYGDSSPSQQQTQVQGEMEAGSGHRTVGDRGAQGCWYQEHETEPCPVGREEGRPGSLVCLSDKSWSVYLNPQCFFICLFKSFPAKKEQKEGGKLPPWATPSARMGLGHFGDRRSRGGRAPCSLGTQPCSHLQSTQVRSPASSTLPPRTCPPSCCFLSPQ